MYQVCTCTRSNLTGGDPQCPIHGQRPVAVTISWCDSCAALPSQSAAKDARIAQLNKQVELLRQDNIDLRIREAREEDGS